MKITFLADASNAHMVKWIDAFRKENDIQIITDRRNPELDESVEQVVYKMSPSKIPGLRQVLLLWQIYKVRTKIRAFSPDVQHVHFLLRHPVAYSLLPKVPMIVSVWGSDIVPLPGMTYDAARMKYLNWYLSRAAKITATSPFLRDTYEKLFQNKYGEAAIIPFGIDTAKFQPGESAHEGGPLVIGFAKTLLPHYGLRDLIEALEPLLKRGAVVLRVAGDGPEGDAMKRLVRKLKLHDSVVFLGRVSPYQMPDFYREVDIYAIPSHRESFGVAALEAGAAGVPVVGTTVGGLPGIIREGETGFLSEPGDREALRASFEKLIENPELRKSMGKAARAHVKENFEWADCVKLMQGVYDEVTK